MMKKTISLSLVLFAIFAFLPGCSISEMFNDVKSLTNHSEGLEFSLDSSSECYILTGIGTCEDKDIVIPSKHNGKPVNKISIRAFMNCEFVESITIPSSIKYICDEAFKNCTSLSKITIPSFVEIIDKRAFEGCSSLKKVYFRNPNNWGIGEYKFEIISGMELNVWVVEPIKENLSNPSTAAELLTLTYVDCRWETIDK